MEKKRWRILNFSSRASVAVRPPKGDCCVRTCWGTGSVGEAGCVAVALWNIPSGGLCNCMAGACAEQGLLSPAGGRPVPVPVPFCAAIRPFPLGRSCRGCRALGGGLWSRSPSGESGKGQDWKGPVEGHLVQTSPLANEKTMA